MSITFVANYPEFPYFLWKSRARSNPSIETNIAMIPRFGIMGAVQATTISYSAACLVLLTAFYFEARISPLEVLVPKLEDLVYFVDLVRRLMQKRTQVDRVRRRGNAMTNE